MRVRGMTQPVEEEPVVDQGTDGVLQAGRVPPRDDEPGHLVRQDIKHPLGVGRHRGQATGHGLDQHLAETLRQGREEHDLVAIEEPGQRGVAVARHDGDSAVPASVEVGEDGFAGHPGAEVAHLEVRVVREQAVEGLRRVVHTLARDVVADQGDAQCRRRRRGRERAADVDRRQAQRHDMAALRVGPERARGVLGLLAAEEDGGVRSR